MTSLLATLRQRAPRTTASAFLAQQFGSYIQYYDDTPARDSAKALSARTFDIAAARRKQRDRCAVGFSLQAFGTGRTADQLLCFRTMGVDVDLVPAADRVIAAPEDIDRMKEAYLRTVLARFPLKPQWLIETRHGFHVLFRVQPQRDAGGIRAAHDLNRQLVRALRGDPNAVLLTQVARVPGSLQFKLPTEPFLCRLLLDLAPTIPPYPLDTVRTALAEQDRTHAADRWGGRSAAEEQGAPVPRWREGLGGVPAGTRNIMAVSLAGKIVGRLPEELWETAGWGGLKEWNARNDGPLPDRELRAVYESITRRERHRRGTGCGREYVPTNECSA
jgi:hypothetical protein